MTTSRPAEESDFRAPQYRGAKVEDYEVRADGVAVRKDRWENAVRHVAIVLGFGREFEISGVVDAFDARIHQGRKAVLDEVIEHIAGLDGEPDRSHIVDSLIEMRNE